MGGGGKGWGWPLAAPGAGVAPPGRDGLRLVVVGAPVGGRFGFCSSAKEAQGLERCLLVLSKLWRGWGRGAFEWGKDGGWVAGGMVVRVSEAPANGAGEPSAEQAESPA